jgi:hypothetical protein
MTTRRVAVEKYLRPARDEHERHRRGMLLGNARRIRADIEQIFTDAAEWNRIHPNEGPIDCDPDGDLRRLANELDELLLSEQSPQ